MIKEQLKYQNIPDIGSWTPDDAVGIWTKLEQPNWAPWLAASAETLAARALVFPDGQKLMRLPDGTLLSSLSVNRVDWDGSIAGLPTWDGVAGDPTDYSTTYQPNGNTLVLMSMNVAPEAKGLHLPTRMLDSVKQLAAVLGVTHLIGSFRPSGYGEVKRGMGYDIDFEQYVFLTRNHSTKPVDPWLGSLWHSGVELMAVDPHAMTVPVPLPEFYAYRQTYKPGFWKEVKPGVWECGEVGQFTLDEPVGLAVYRESNVWGMIPFS